VSKTIGEENYEQFAERYAEHSETKPHNAYYERPATLSLLPDVSGMHVLDAGCGPGFYAQWLLDHGAAVTAFDITPAFVRITQERVGARAQVLRANLEEPLVFAKDGSFDLVLCSLVLDYIRDWGKVFAEFYRVLKPGGLLVFSCGHTTFDWIYFDNGDSNYFETEMVEMEWTGFGEPYPRLRTYRRPLADQLNPLLSTGFRLDQILEARPIDALKEINPEEYARLNRRPGFMCVRAVK